MRERIYNAFHRNIDDFDSSMLDQVRDKLRALSPVDETEQAGIESYEESFLVRFTYESNAIEGSTLDLMETDLVLEGEFKPRADTRLRDVFAARGIADGCAFISRALASGVSVSEDFIKDIHERTALDCQPAVRGMYRLVAVYLRGSKTVPADALKIRDLMPTLLHAWEASDAHPVAKAAAFHAMFENIHPFQDGNGRTGRLLMNYMLEQEGYPPIAIKHDGSLDYKKALEDWQVREDPTSLLHLVSGCVISEIKERTHIVQDSRILRAALRDQGRPPCNHLSIN